MTLPVLPRSDQTVVDTLRRPLRDLRISVTDRCNFRCSFCMPGDRAYSFVPRREIFSFEEMTRVARLCVDLGVRKVRLTGGEPLLRKDLDRLVTQLRAIEGVEDLALTTNGALLADNAAPLAAAGLSRVTVSFHSLDAESCRRIGGPTADLDAVLRGLTAARSAGLPVKLNVVPLADVNEHELVDLAGFGREHGYTVRFIEYMDVGTVNRWQPSAVLAASEIVERLDAVWPLEPVAPAHRGEVALRYRYRDGGGEVGVIPSVTQPFCGDCNRLRLSAEGQLYTCLFAQHGSDIKTPLRAGESDDQLRVRLASLWQVRADRYSEQRSEALRQGTFEPADKVEMFRIGG